MVVFGHFKAPYISYYSDLNRREVSMFIPFILGIQWMGASLPSFPPPLPPSPCYPTPLSESLLLSTFNVSPPKPSQIPSSSAMVRKQALPGPLQAGRARRLEAGPSNHGTRVVV